MKIISSTPLPYLMKVGGAPCQHDLFSNHDHTQEHRKFGGQSCMATVQTSELWLRCSVEPFFPEVTSALL
jgi:hypothetical protein